MNKKKNCLWASLFFLPIFLVFGGLLFLLLLTSTSDTSKMIVFSQV